MHNSKELCTCHGIGVALRGFFHIHDLLERLPRTTASTSNGAFARVLKITRKFNQYTEVMSGKDQNNEILLKKKMTNKSISNRHSRMAGVIWILELRLTFSPMPWSIIYCM